MFDLQCVVTYQEVKGKSAKRLKATVDRGKLAGKGKNG
jgi:hypothetical protein